MFVHLKHQMFDLGFGSSRLELQQRMRLRKSCASCLWPLDDGRVVVISAQLQFGRFYLSPIDARSWHNNETIEHEIIKLKSSDKRILCGNEKQLLVMLHSVMLYSH